MNGLSKGRRGFLVLAAGAIMTIALASGAGAVPGEVWTTRPLSDASYVAQGDRIPSTRWLSDSTFLPNNEGPEIPSTRWLSDSSFVPSKEPVALNRYLSDASYYPTVSQPQVSPAGDSSAAGSTDRSDVLRIVGLLTIVAGAAGLIVVFGRYQRRPAV
jgi:hypothetical protein